jgi:hypothetical protein
MLYKLCYYYWPRSPPDAPSDDKDGDQDSDPTWRPKRSIASSLKSTLQASLHANEQLLDHGDEPQYGTVHVISHYIPTINGISESICTHMAYCLDILRPYAVWSR